MDKLIQGIIYWMFTSGKKIMLVFFAILALWPLWVIPLLRLTVWK